MELVVEHLRHDGAYLNDASYHVELYQDEELLNTYGFYVLLDYDLQSAILHKVNLARFQTDLKMEDYYAKVYNNADRQLVCKYKWVEQRRLFIQDINI